MGVKFPYYCTTCGRNAKINHPGKDPDGNIHCFQCTSKLSKDTVFELVNQSTLETEGLQYRGIIVLNLSGLCAWGENGLRGIPITKDEQGMKMIDVLRVIENEIYEQNVFRCTGCKQKFEGQSSGKAKFVGILCTDCAKKDANKTERERKMGHVCLMCRKPYNICCC